MHYRVSYNYNIYYHIYVSRNINGADALTVVNKPSCERYTHLPQNTPHPEPFAQLSPQNGIASIFAKSDDAPQLTDANQHLTILHIYLDNGTDDDAFKKMVMRLNEINNNNTPRIIKL